MTEPDASLQTSALVLDVSSYAAERTAIVTQLEKLDDPVYDVLVAFQAAHPELVPCGSSFPWRDKKQLKIWTVSEADDSGIKFTHDCTDHWYDLHNTESVTVPAGWLSDPRQWNADHKAELARTAAREAATIAAARRAEYEALRTEFEPKDV